MPTLPNRDEIFALARSSGLTAFDRYEFDSAAAILLIIIVIVMGLEYGSGYLRRWVQ